VLVSENRPNLELQLMRITMKKIALYLIVCLTFGCGQSDKASQKEPSILPKIAIAGIAIESSTFSPAQSTEEAFHAKTDEEVFSIYPFFAAGAPNRKRAHWVPTLKGHALPGGIVTREAYESLVKKTLNRLKQNLPYDGLFLDLHGAMSVVGLDDPEGDFIARIRQVVGTDTLISTSMDLHGNVSQRLAQHSDLITCYRMAPHEDAMESKKRAVDNLLERLESGKGKPAYKAWIPVPILLPGEKTSTRIEPGKTLYAKVDPLTKRDGIIDAAIWVGYAWAEELAKSFWEVRHQFDFVAPTTTLEDSLNKAIASAKKPYIISDMGDNPTAGDVTWTLTENTKTSRV
jgi:microcystin degradation protein MlrC